MPINYSNLIDFFHPTTILLKNVTRDVYLIDMERLMDRVQDDYSRADSPISSGCMFCLLMGVKCQAVPAASH